MSPNPNKAKNRVKYNNFGNTESERTAYAAVCPAIYAHARAQ